jgi:hypothetical protein
VRIDIIIRQERFDRPEAVDATERHRASASFGWFAIGSPSAIALLNAVVISS